MNKQIINTFAILITLLVSSCSKVESTENIAIVQLQSAQLLVIAPQQNYQVARQYIGKIKAKHQTNLSFEYSGKTTKIFVDSGDRVKKGQALAQQNTQLLTFKRKELKSYIKQAHAEITLNRANLVRTKSLIGNGYTSEQKLDELNAENKVLQAKIDAFKAQLETIKYQIEKTTLVAPFDAFIGERLLSKGEVVNAGQTVFKLIEQANNEVSVGVPSKLAITLQVGEVFTIEVNQQVSKATLVSIGQQVDPISRTVQLRIALTEQQDRLNGSLVKVTINEKIEQAGFWIPLEGIIDGVRGQWNVYLAQKSKNRSIESNKTSSIYQIKTATVRVLYANENSAYISGLPLEKQTIVSKGLHRFVPGQQVYASGKSDLGKAQ